MKKGFAFILIALFALWATPVAGIASSGPATAQLSSSPFELGYDDGIPGPQRDPGPNWITYDDGGPARLNTDANYWTRVTFTPNSRFSLQAIRFMPLNQGPNDSPCRVIVYTENQDNHNLDEVAWETELEELDPWDGQNQNANWVLVEIPEDEFVVFDAQENFSILYGPAPGGAYGNPPQQGQGWWNLMDGSADANRSFQLLGAAIQQAHNRWRAGGGDYLLRANGEYLEAFIDLAVVQAYNDAENWMMTPGTEQTFIADIANYGDDVDAYVVTFQVLDTEGNPIFTTDVVGQDIAADDTTAIECDEVWEAPEDLGLYTLWVTVDAGDDDANADNNIAGLDQIVFNPDPEAGDPDMWIGYIDDATESSTSWNEDSGWCTLFHHPGGETAYWVTAFRVEVSSADAQAHELQFGINVYDAIPNTFTPVWQGTAETEGQGAQWVEVELAEEDYVTMRENQALMVAYFFVEPVAIRVDGTPPFAGTNEPMPWAMMQTGNDGQSFYWGRTGDFPIQIKLGVSDERIEGPAFRIEPAEVNFNEVYGGDDGSLERGREYTIEARFISIGDTTVEINDIRLSPTAADYFAVSDTAFVIAFDETAYVDITFLADTLIEMQTQFLVSNNSDTPNMLWRVFASTLPVSINRNVQPGTPQEYTLNQNHPNPFNPITTVDFALIKGGMVSFDIFDMSGRLVNQVYQGNMPAGYHSIDIDASSMPAGIYLYRLQTDEFTSSRKMILLK